MMGTSLRRLLLRKSWLLQNIQRASSERNSVGDQSRMALTFCVVRLQEENETHENRKIESVEVFLGGGEAFFD